jgi:stage IV sporulation protein FB
LNNKKIKIPIIKIHRVEINIIIFIIAGLSLLTGFLPGYLIVFISMMVHETGHIIAGMISGGRLHSITILPVGFNARICGLNPDMLTVFAVNGAGPFINLVIYGICYASQSIFSIESKMLDLIIVSNLVLAIFNLLPVLPLDGGRILMHVVANRKGFFFAYNILRKISMTVSSVIIMSGVVQITANPHNFSLLAIGLYMMYFLKSEETEASLMNMKHIIYRRMRFLKKGMYEVRQIAALESMHVGEVLKFMDFDRFHMVFVLDENLKIKGMLTEQEIMDNMVSNTTDITFDELIKGKS